MSTVSFNSLGNPGTYASGNIIDSGGAKSEFLNFNPSTLTYNVMLRAGAQAIGAGAADGAPTIDILGSVSLPTPRGPVSYPLSAEDLTPRARGAERVWRN